MSESESESTREMVTVAVQTETNPTFDLSYPKGEDETDEEAHEWALNLAKHDAAVALSEVAHEYDWEEVPTHQKENRSENQIGTLTIGESASVNDIETMIDMGLESLPWIELESNQDGTYDIIDTSRDEADN